MPPTSFVGLISRLVRNRSPRSGFALIIVLTLMAFLVLLFVTLTVSIQVASQVSTYNLQATQAKLNALYGVNVAIAQLQKFAGPDNRVTGTADFFRRNDNGNYGTGNDTSTALPTTNLTYTYYADNTDGGSNTTNAPANTGGTRYWTAVWGSGMQGPPAGGNPAAPIYGNYITNNTTLNTFNPPAPVLLNWLVSGNENTPFPTANSPVNGSNFTYIKSIIAATPTFAPNVLITGNGSGSSNNSLSINTTATTGLVFSNVTVNGLNPQGVLLVGANSAGNSSTNLVLGSGGATVTQPPSQRYVVAPLVPIVAPSEADNASSGATITTGTYAYWVGDEGVKARYNTPDNLSNSTLDGSAGSITVSNVTAANFSVYYSGTANSVQLPKSFSYLYRLMVPRRSGIETVGNLSSYPVNNAQLLNIAEPLQAHYVSNNPTGVNDISQNTTLANDPIRQHFHDLTTYSMGVLSDTARGGLKYDLTTAFEQSAVYQNDLQNKKILPDGSTAQSGGNSTWPDYAVPAISPQAGPYWNSIYNFYNASNTTAYNSPVPVGPGVVPVVVQGRLLFGITTWPGTLEFYITTSAMFVLANPYNFTITATNGLDLRYAITNHTGGEWGMAVVARSGTGNGISPVYLKTFDRVGASRVTNGQPDPLISLGGTTFTGVSDFNDTYFPVLSNYADFANDNHRSVLSNVTFHIGNLTLQPGQSLVYVLGGGSTGSYQASDQDTAGVWSNTYVSAVPGGGGVAGSSTGLSTTQQVVQMIPVTNASVNMQAFFLTDTGSSAGPPASSAAGFLATMLPSPACSLIMSTNLTTGNPTILQTISGLDLTGDSINNSLQTSPNLISYGHILPGDKYLSPYFIGSYYFFLGMPALFAVPNAMNTNITVETGPAVDLINGGSGYNGTTYSIYSQFNLRAANIAVPPWVKYNTPSVNSANSTTTGLPTVPPYVRMFDRGFEADVDAVSQSNSATSAYNLGNNAFITGLGYSVSNVLIPTWGHSNGIGGTGKKDGQLSVVLYQLPWRAGTAGKTFSLPVLSLGQLQHADVTADDIYNSVGYQPGNAFGNSLFSPFVNTTGSMQVWANQQMAYTGQPGTGILNGLNTTVMPVVGTKLGPGVRNPNVGAYDISYLVNAAIWDHYYFSGVSQNNNINNAVTFNAALNPALVGGQMANPRMKFAAGFAPNNTLLNITAGNGPGATALGLGVPDLQTSTTNKTNYMPQGYALSRYLMNSGAFNVNSTSVEAWRALLASLRGLAPVPVAAPSAINANRTFTATDVVDPVEAFPRVLPSSTLLATTNPISLANYTYNGTAGPGGSGAMAGDSAQSYGGFRTLTDADITNLATAIVQQVRVRGPFLSLAQFVNRTLAPSTNAASLSGPLQSAINSIPNVVAGANGNFNTLQDLGFNTGDNSNETISIYPSSSSVPNSYSSQVYSNNFTAANVPLSRSQGIPGWLTQADVLQYLAPVLAARSDTFVIRAYGQLNNPLDGTARSRAWCEAVVQRYPEYIDTVTVNSNPANTLNSGAPDNPAVMPWQATLQNDVFGRRFRLVSLRWLTPNDI